MLAYTLKRLLLAVPALFGLPVIVFLIMAMIPGDPATAILGSYATPENVERLNRQLGLDRSLFEQYLVWLGNLLQGDFGRSYNLNRPVIDEVLERFSATLILAGAALLLCSIFGLLAGVVTAVRQYGWADKIVTFFVLIGISVPSFWLGLLLILAFAVWRPWLPASGMFAIYGGGDLPDLLHHLVLPAVTLAVVATGVIARLTRAAMLEVLRQDYIRTARAKGVGEQRVIYRHAFKAALVSVIPVIGVQAGFVLGGAVYIETVFQWPGIGRMLVTAISTRDLLLVQGGVLVVATRYVLLNLVTDLLQHLADAGRRRYMRRTPLPCPRLPDIGPGGLRRCGCSCAINWRPSAPASCCLSCSSWRSHRSCRCTIRRRRTRSTVCCVRWPKAIFSAPITWVEIFSPDCSGAAASACLSAFPPPPWRRLSAPRSASLPATSAAAPIPS